MTGKEAIDILLGKIPQDQNLTFKQKMLYVNQALSAIEKVIEECMGKDVRKSKLGIYSGGYNARSKNFWKKWKEKS